MIKRANVNYCKEVLKTYKTQGFKGIAKYAKEQSSMKKTARALLAGKLFKALESIGKTRGTAKVGDALKLLNKNIQKPFAGRKGVNLNHPDMKDFKSIANYKKDLKTGVGRMLKWDSGLKIPDNILNKPLYTGIDIAGKPGRDVAFNRILESFKSMNYNMPKQPAKDSINALRNNILSTWK